MGKSSFDYGRLRDLRDILQKRAFVPIDPKSAQAAPPDAGGMPPPEGDPAAMGADPAAMGADPAAMGGMPPMDPAAMGGAMPPGPPPGGPMDPMMGMPPPDGGEVSPDGEPYIKMTMKQLIKLVEQIAQLSTKITSPAQQAPAPQQSPDAASLAEVNAKMDAIMNYFGG